jgi:CheY-like chemotaxis protein
VTPNGRSGPAGPVLVVDDDTVSRLVLAHMLRGLGFEVVQADDLGPAVELLGRTDFAVVFSDYSMPGGTGLQLFQTLRSTVNRPSFVLVTGIVDRAGHGEPGGDAVDAHLAKPVSTRSLRACLRTIESRVPSP